MHQEILDPEEVELLKEAATDFGLDFRTDYSGRSMYGALCVGFVYDDLTDFLAALVYIAQENDDLAETLARSACTDSMGLSMIVYFPRLTISESSAEA